MDRGGLEGFWVAGAIERAVLRRGKKKVAFLDGDFAKRAGEISANF